MKDRLYTFAAGSAERRSAQTALFIIADGLARLLAPMLPMTSDELWPHLPGAREASVHLAEFPHGVEWMYDARSCRTMGSAAANSRRGESRARSAHVRRKRSATRLARRWLVRARGEEAQLSSRYQADLRDAVHRLAGRASSADGEGPGVDVTVTRAEGSKCPRCWRIVPSVRRPRAWKACAIGVSTRCRGERHVAG